MIGKRIVRETILPRIHPFDGTRSINGARSRQRRLSFGATRIDSTRLGSAQRARPTIRLITRKQVMSTGVDLVVAAADTVTMSTRYLLSVTQPPQRSFSAVKAKKLPGNNANPPLAELVARCLEPVSRDARGGAY